MLLLQIATMAGPGDEVKVAIHAKREAAAIARGGTYVLKYGDDVVRTGRTNDLARRATEHARHPDTSAFRFVPVHRTDDPAARRGLEQILHDQFNPPLDLINPINPSNPNRGTYMDAAREYLYTLDPP